MNRVYLLLVLLTLTACRSVSPQPRASQPVLPAPASESQAPKNSVAVIHVFVALCDNVNQGIVPVSASLGNGDDSAKNLYWGAGFGVKTFFGKSHDWQLLTITNESGKSASVVLDRVVFRHRKTNTFLIAEAYRGRYIRQATEDFLSAAAGAPGETLTVSADGKSMDLHTGGSANLVAYVGHNGLMDFQLSSIPRKRDAEKRDSIILACASKGYFAAALRETGATPLLWTTNLMAPEAYVLSAALDGWMNHETDDQIRFRAAKAYDQYQHCGIKSANTLFATGW